MSSADDEHAADVAMDLGDAADTGNPGAGKLSSLYGAFRERHRLHEIDREEKDRLAAELASARADLESTALRERAALDEKQVALDRERAALEGERQRRAEMEAGQQQIAEMLQRLEEGRRREGEQRQELARLHALFAELETHARHLQDHVLPEHLREINTLRAEVEGLRSQLAATEQARAGALHELDLVMGSKSWRVTRPMRRMIEWLKGSTRGPEARVEGSERE